MHKRKKEYTVLLFTMCLPTSCTNLEEYVGIILWE